MFLTKMVNNFISNINETNQQQPGERPQQNKSRTGASNYRTYKKSNKSRKSSAKNSYKNDEVEQLPETSIKNPVNTNEHSKTNNRNVPATKVKSASWKNSEKSINNPLTNKKHKNLQKKSPNWLKFSNSKIKKSDSSQLIKRDESTSACRPGTLYSDVLFGAGCSNLVKIKNCITPRFYNNTAQKKLTKALLKFNGNLDRETSDESEVEGKKHLFPALHKIKNKIRSSNKKNDASTFENNTVIEGNTSKNELPTTITSSTFAATAKNGVYEDADVIVSDLKGLSLQESMSYGNYLEQHLKGTIETDVASSSRDKKFLLSAISNIPKWNFFNTETSDDFPKYLCQFDDENYLIAENIAFLGLKLALGNYPR